MPRSRVALVAMIALLAGCDTSASPTPLVGIWTNAAGATSFVATASAITFDQPCLHATFTPVNADSSNSFAISTASLVNRGNLAQSIGDVLHLDGRIAGDTLFLTMFTVHVSGPADDPVTLTLLGSSAPLTLLCTA